MDCLLRPGGDRHCSCWAWPLIDPTRKTSAGRSLGGTRRFWLSLPGCGDSTPIAVEAEAKASPGRDGCYLCDRYRVAIWPAGCWAHWHLGRWIVTEHLPTPAMPLLDGGVGLCSTRC